jgi:hypothetical protein
MTVASSGVQTPPSGSLAGNRYKPLHLGDHASAGHAAKQLPLLLGRYAQTRGQFARFHRAKIPHLNVCQCGCLKLSESTGHVVILLSTNCLLSNNKEME